MPKNEMKLKIRAKPNSKESKLEKSEGTYIAYLKSPAKNNKANFELIKLLSKQFETPPKNIKIKNPTSKNKLVEIKCQQFKCKHLKTL